MSIQAALTGAAYGPVALTVATRAVAGADATRTNVPDVIAPFSPPGPPAVDLAPWELLTASLALATGLLLLHHQLAKADQLYAVLWLAATGTPLMMIDWACHRLPTRLITTTFSGGVVFLSLAAVTHDQFEALCRAFAASGIVTTAALLVALAAHGSLGAGDVKLLGTIALYLGWSGWTQVIHGLFTALCLAAVSGALLVITGRLARGAPLAFGPAIVGGAVLTLAFQ